jgi:hypothetical protein
MDGVLELDTTETESLLLQTARGELGISISGATANFCSSVSTALGSPSDEIPEKPIALDCALMGYGQSKLVGERIVSNARHSGARAYSLRIGRSRVTLRKACGMTPKLYRR